MEIRTTLKNFSEQMKYYRILPETYIRVIIDDTTVKTGNTGRMNTLPFITPEEQRRLLSLIPGEYHPGASEELIKIIEESHINTDMPDLK